MDICRHPKNQSRLSIPPIVAGCAPRVQGLHPPGEMVVFQLRTEEKDGAQIAENLPSLPISDLSVAFFDG